MSEIETKIVYSSVRAEILEQKKCQLQVVGGCITLSTAALALASNPKTSPLVCIPVMLLNVLCLAIVLDKATSIQRMVGYLQLMESENRARWMWEYHLNIFRALVSPKGCDADAPRKHKYARNIALMLGVLNLFAVALFFFGPGAIEFKKSDEYFRDERTQWALGLIVAAVNLAGFVIAVRRRHQLVRGDHTSAAIRARWLQALADADAKLAPSAVAKTA